MEEHTALTTKLTDLSISQILIQLEFTEKNYKLEGAHSCQGFMGRVPLTG